MPAAGKRWEKVGKDDPATCIFSGGGIIYADWISSVFVAYSLQSKKPTASS